MRSGSSCSVGCGRAEPVLAGPGGEARQEAPCTRRRPRRTAAQPRHATLRRLSLPTASSALHPPLPLSARHSLAAQHRLLLSPRLRRRHPSTPAARRSSVRCCAVARPCRRSHTPRRHDGRLGKGAQRGARRRQGAARADEALSCEYRRAAYCTCCEKQGPLALAGWLCTALRSKLLQRAADTPRRTLSS
jgi:hypothetical protein